MSNIFIPDFRFLDNINSAYSYANTSLLDLLITTHALPARLCSLKHYFFLDRSDFFTHFLDLADTELKKSSKLISLSKLQSLLDLSLRLPGSVAASDPFKEDVKVQMNDMALTDWLMRIVKVSGLAEDALISGTWTEEAVSVNPENESDEKKTITGASFSDSVNIRCECSAIRLHCSISSVTCDLEESGITISIIISSFTRPQEYREAFMFCLDGSRQDTCLDKSINTHSSREMEITRLGPPISDVSLCPTVVLFLHE